MATKKRASRPRKAPASQVTHWEAPQSSVAPSALPEVPLAPIVQPGVSQAPSVAFLEPDPLHPALAVSFVLAAKRVLDFASDHPSEIAPEPFVRGTMARVCVQDPNVKLILAVDSGTGEVLAHLLATIESNGVDTWVFCWQAQVEQGATGVLQQLIEYATPWAKSRGANRVLMATHLDPEFWRQRYGFEVVRHVMSRPL